MNIKKKHNTKTSTHITRPHLHITTSMLWLLLTYYTTHSFYYLLPCSMYSSLSIFNNLNVEGSCISKRDLFCMKARENHSTCRRSQPVKSPIQYKVFRTSSLTKMLRNNGDVKDGGFITSLDKKLQTGFVVSRDLSSQKVKTYKFYGTWLNERELSLHRGCACLPMLGLSLAI